MDANYIECNSTHTLDQSLAGARQLLFRDWGVLSPHPLDVGLDQMESNLVPFFLAHGLLFLGFTPKLPKLKEDQRSHYRFFCGKKEKFFFKTLIRNTNYDDDKIFSRFWSGILHSNSPSYCAPANRVVFPQMWKDLKNELRTSSESFLPCRPARSLFKTYKTQKYFFGWSWFSDPREQKKSCHGRNCVF